MGHKKHCKLYLVSLICIISLTPNRPLRNTPLSPNRPLTGTAAFDSNIVHVEQINHWKPSRGSKMCYIWPFDSIPVSVLQGRLKRNTQLLPTGHWVAAASRSMGAHSIMMLMKFSDLSQSDRSNWVMSQFKDPCPRPGWDWCLTRENGFHKSMKTWIILLYIWLLL